MRVLADLHGDGNTDDEKAKEEFREIKSGILADRLVGDRSYGAMWTRYRSRVLIAMSAQAFAQLVSFSMSLVVCEVVLTDSGLTSRTVSMSSLITHRWSSNLLVGLEETRC